MFNFNSIVQVFPVNSKAARFDCPPGALFGRGFGEPLQPFHPVNRQADLTAIAEKDEQQVIFKAKFFRSNLGMDINS